MIINLFIVLAAVLINPFFIILILGLIQLFIKKNFQIAKIVLPISMALLVNTRGSIAGDDAVYYIGRFIDASNEGFIDIVNNFITNPKDNEPILYLLTKFISLGDFESTYIFSLLIYYIQFQLVFISAKYISNDHQLTYIAFFLFGFGAFLDQPVLHLWRSNIASLLFYIGFLAYINGNSWYKISYVFSFLTHIVSIPFGGIFYIYSRFKVREKSLYCLFYGLIISVIFIIFCEYILNIMSLTVYLESYKPYPTSIYSLIVVLFFLILRRDPNNNGFSIVILSFFIILYFYPNNFSPVVGRMFMFITPIITYSLFCSLMSYKVIFAFLLPVLYIKKTHYLLEGGFVSEVLPDYFSIFNGILFTI